MTSEGIKAQLLALSNVDALSAQHIAYLIRLREHFRFEPAVIYDIGACVLHWTKEARKVWPNAKIYLFDGMDTVNFLYEEQGYEYHCGVLSDVDGREVTFYQSDVSPGGNSYYRENSWATEIYYGKDSERIVRTDTVDTVVNKKEFRYPDLVKIDVQGCEIDILKGMSETLKHCKHLIVELQHSQYNSGAPLDTESVPFIESLGFRLVEPLFCNNGPDGDYHFERT
jgi:FkbM family methyltransferase